MQKRFAQAQSDEDKFRRRKKAEEDERYAELREVNAVASSFGSLFKSGKSGKMHWFSPVLTGSDSVEITPKNSRHDYPGDSPTMWGSGRQGTSREAIKERNRLRRSRSTELLMVHTKLVRSEHVERLGVASLLDIPRKQQMSPYHQETKGVYNKSIGEAHIDMGDETDPIVSRKARHYADLCQKNNVPPIAKLLPRPEVASEHHATQSGKGTRKRMRRSQSNVNKKALQLSDRGLTYASFEILSSTIIPDLCLSGLHTVNLSKNKRMGGAKAMLLLHKGLCDGKAPKLRELDLSDCGLGIEGTITITKLLSPSTGNQLSVLKLAGNRLTDQFINMFAKLYEPWVRERRKKDMTRLTYLDLRNNEISAQGGIMLGHCISNVGTAIETLLLGWNHLGWEGARAILRGFVQVKPVTRVSRLDLSFNRLSDSWLYPDNALQAFLSGTRALTLTSLDLSHNELGQMTAEHLVTALSARNRIQELRVGFNPLGTIGTARMIEASRQNALRTLMIENTTMTWGSKKRHSGDEHSHGIELSTGNDVPDDDEDDDSALDPSADVQYIWELAERVKRAKSVLLMMRVRRKYKVEIHVEYPPQERVAQNRLFQPVMGWLSGRARRNHGSDAGGEGKIKGDKDGEDVDQNTDSVFHARIGESESRSFWDSPHVIGAAFEEDYIKINWHKFLKLSHQEETKMHDCLKSHYVLLKELFHYYAATKSGRAKSGFAIAMNAMHIMVEEMGLWPKGKSRATLDMMFVHAAVDRHKQEEHLVKKKRAKYLHKDFDDNFSLGSGTGLNSSSLSKFVLSRNQIAEVHSVRKKIEREQSEKHGQKKIPKKANRGKRQASFHEDDESDIQMEKEAQEAKHQDSKIITMENKKRRGKKKRRNKKNQNANSGMKAARAAAAAKAKMKKAKKEKEEKASKGTGGASFGAQTLKRSEFLGFMLRLATNLFYDSGKCDSVEEAIEKMMEDHVIPNAFKGVSELCDSKYLFDRNMFRDEKLYFVEIDQVFRENYIGLQAIYSKYSSDETAGSADTFAYKGRFKEGDVMSLNDFVKVVQSMDRQDFIDACTRRAMNLSFCFAQMLCSGEDEAASLASFCEFLEALARLADMCIGKELKGMRIPLSMQLRQLVDSLIKGNSKIVKQFSSHMEADTANAAKVMSASKTRWTKEARSTSLDMTMAWMARTKQKLVKAADQDNSETSPQ